MRTATTISALGHGAVLLWSVWSLAARPLINPPTDSLPVDVVSAAEFSQITQGVKEAPKAEKQKPLVEKIAEAKPVEDLTAKVVEKKEVKAAREPPPAPEAKPVEAKPEEKKTEQKPQEAAPEKKTADAKPDQIAQALEKADSKPDPKKAEEKTHADKTPSPPKKSVPPAPKFDPKRVEALLDKRDPTRLAAAGETINNAPSFGLSSAKDAHLSLNELEAFRARLAQLWTPPAGARSPQELVVVVRVRLKPDGTLAAPPEVLNSGTSLYYIASRDSAKRAVIRGQPYDMFKPEHYEQWKDIEITFDPRDMIRS
jgi:membrane protein involved in colicin uptake